MIKFLKRYLHLRGDFSDEKRSKEFENKVNSLMANSLKFFFDTFIHFQGLFEVLTLHQMYPNDMSRVSDFSQFKINDIYVDDDSSEKIRYMIQLIILRLISPLESGDLYSKTNYEDGLRMTKVFALGLKESVLEDKLHNALLNDISNLKKRDTYHFDGSLCDCIDYAINLDDSAALSDASYSLKKVFLCKDDFNTDAIFLMRKALLEDKRNSYLLNIEEINPKSRDLVSLYSVDAAIIVDMCGKNFIGNIPNINDVNFFNGRIKDYVIYVVGLIYARRLLDVFTLIVARIDDSDIYEKKLAIFLSKCYNLIGLHIYQFVYKSFSVQDLILYIVNEYFHDMMVRAKFYNPVYKTELFESFAKGNISSFRFYKKFDEELKIILKEAANILKNNPELFHDQLFKIFDENKKYKRILAKPGFKTILYRELQDLCQYTGLGKVRGLKKNNVRCYDKYGSTSR